MNLQTKINAKLISSPKLFLSPFNNYLIEDNIFSLKNEENLSFNRSLIAMVALQAADYFISVKAVKREDIQEANPFMKPFVEKPFLFAVFKAGSAALSVKLLSKLHKRNKNLALFVSSAIDFVLAYVVFQNLSLLE